MSLIKNENYIVEHGWMINRLGLKGNELRIYAIIYGFTQTGNQTYTGNLQYLADWVNGTKRGVIKNLNTLVEKGYIEKTARIVNGVKQCTYRATELIASGEQNSPGVMNNVHRGGEQNSPGVMNNVHRGGEQNSPNIINNKDIQNTIDIQKDKKAGASPAPIPPVNPRKRSKVDTEAILQRYAQDAETLELLRDWLKVRKAKRAPQTERALTLNLDKLGLLAQQSGCTVPDYLKAVIARGWAAFFPLNDYSGKQPAQDGRSRIKTEAEHAQGGHASGFGW